MTDKTAVATAPGKVILFGEHAVVYGRPAIAAPLSHVRARASLESIENNGVILHAPDLSRKMMLSDAAEGDPLAAPLRAMQQAGLVPALSGVRLTVTSDIPIASGLGSGAAIAVAVIRAMAAYSDLPSLDAASVSRLAFEVEKQHHGTPSGIDNTVIAYETPVYFERRDPESFIEIFSPARPLILLVGDTGVRSATRHVVGDVRRQWLADRERFEDLFDACGKIAAEAKEAIALGDPKTIGLLMTQNHDWLRKMTVSSTELDTLVEAAIAAGAYGAKLSGAGRGGNMIALVSENSRDAVAVSLRKAGAVQVLESRVT